MQINKSDKINCENLIKLLRRAKIELQGAEEVLGTAEILRWTSGLSLRIATELKEQEDAVNAMAALATAKAVESLAPQKSDKKSKSKKAE